MSAHAEITLPDARRAVLEAARVLEPEPVALDDALGRVLAEDVQADESLPPFANSAMDGFALRSADTLGAAGGRPVRLALVGESRAGAPAATVVGAGEACRISTGAVLPEGADCVLRVEDASLVEDGQLLELALELEAGKDVRPAGDDVAAGSRVLPSGTLLRAGEIAMLAAVGRGEIPCHRRPRVAVLTTGDELVSTGGTLAPGQIRDSNSQMVSALVREQDAEVVSLQRAVTDEQEPTSAAVAEVFASDPPDVLICCGGVSVGEHDHVRPALLAAGAEEHFWQVAMRPGHPVWFGTREGGSGSTLIFGLPGNPVSAFVTFQMFAAPALRALAGGQALPEQQQAVLADAVRKRPGDALVLRCRIERGADGDLRAQLTSANQRSHAISSLVATDALALVPAEVGGLVAGSTVTIERT